MMTSFDNKEDKICSLLKDNVGGLCVRSCARSRIRLNDYKSYDHGIIIAFFFGMSSDKQIIVKKPFATR